MMPNVVDLPESARVDTFFSPPFTTAPPELRNAHLLGQGLRDIYAILWDQSHGPEEVVCSVALDAIVEGPGLVFDRDLNLLRQTIHQATPEEIGAAYKRVLHAVQHGGPSRQHGVTLLCEKAGIGNYGHWLIEMLPIAYLNLKHLASGGWRLRLPAAGAAMNEVMRDSVELIGVPSAQVDVRLPGPQRYEQLVLVRGLGHHGIRYSPLVIGCMEALAQAVPAQAAEKVWVSRAGDRRSMQDEPALCAALAGRGWQVAEPGRMTLREQIGLFRGARRIAGVAGAGLTNLVFAEAGARITAFTPATMPDVFFWMLAGFKGHAYRDVRCPLAAVPDQPHDWNGPLLMEIPEVLAHLD